jgi:preprotein translocase subunit SecD
MSNAVPAVRAAWVVLTAGVLLLAGCATGRASSAASTVAVVDVEPVAGAAAPDLTDVASRLRGLLSAMGFANAQADVAGSDRLTVTVDGSVPVTQLQAALEPGPLLFRKVLNAGPGVSKGAVPTAPSGSNSPALTLDAVKAAVGSQAWAAALVVAATPHDVSRTNSDRLIVNALAPFGRLTPTQVALLPPTMQFYVPEISCATLNARESDATDNPQATVVACDNKSTKYLLDVAKVSGSDVSSATAAPDISSGWAVQVAFSSAGGRVWSALSSEAFNNAGGHCTFTVPNIVPGNAPVCEIAVAQDNTVLTAPAIQAVLPPQADLLAFTQQQAMTLAAQLALAGLPVRIAVVSVSS